MAHGCYFWNHALGAKKVKMAAWSSSTVNGRRPVFQISNLLSFSFSRLFSKNPFPFLFFESNFWSTSDETWPLSLSLFNFSRITGKILPNKNIAIETNLWFIASCSGLLPDWTRHTLLRVLNTFYFVSYRITWKTYVSTHLETRWLNLLSDPVASQVATKELDTVRWTLQIYSNFLLLNIVQDYFSEINILMVLLWLRTSIFHWPPLQKTRQYFLNCP